MTTSSSASPAEGGTRAVVGVLLDAFPRSSETFVTTEIRALAVLGHVVHVEATRRGDTTVDLPPGVDVHWREDDPGAGPSAAVLAGLRRPRATLRDSAGRRRWKAGEQVPRTGELLAPLSRLRSAGVQHLHAHFAAGAALDALRLSRLLGITWSVTAHAYDIYQRPENLGLKLRDAAFSTSGCDYTVAELRRVAGDGHADRIHRVVMGVDGTVFRRGSPLPGGRRVLAVGRLVEKKGFGHLIAAAAQLEARGTPLDELVIVGDGPLRDELRRAAGVLPDGRVRFAGRLDPAGVRRELERADLLAMPSVVARDGDRDSMPVVVKEALAMELLVVASDEVGLPEIVRRPAGRLVPPGSPHALAAGLEAALALPLDARIEAGRAGRALVLEEADAGRETSRLSALIQGAVADGRR